MGTVSGQGLWATGLPAQCEGGEFCFGQGLYPMASESCPLLGFQKLDSELTGPLAPRGCSANPDVLQTPKGHHRRARLNQGAMFESKDRGPFSVVSWPIKG